MADNNKYLTFALGKENYGIPIGMVKEIIGMLEITSMPKTPNYLKGVINLRGGIIPIMDLRLKFDLEEKEYNDRTCIIVADCIVGDKNKRVGIAVDAVSEVIDIDEENIEEMEKSDINIDSEFITGIAKVRDKIIILISINKIMSKKDMNSIVQNTVS